MLLMAEVLVRLKRAALLPPVLYLWGYMKILLRLKVTALLLITAACSVSSPTPTPAVIQSPDLGSLTGVLQVRSGQMTLPVRAVTLFLAETIKDSNAQEYVAGFSRPTSPRTTTDNQGHFLFSNVQPGNYGLVLDNITTSYLLLTPGSGESLIVQVTVGKQTELGTLLYDSLPVPVKLDAYPYP